MKLLEQSIGYLSDIKDRLNGIKSVDDKLAKNLLNDINRFKDIQRGYGHFDASINFSYSGYRFEIFSGYGKMYIPSMAEPVSIKSKFLLKLQSKLKKIVEDKESKIYLKKSQDLYLQNTLEFQNAVKHHGGIGNIAEIILLNIQNPKSYWNGQIRLDKGNELVMLSPTNTTEYGRSIINTLIVNLNTGKTRLHKSYGAFTNHKQYDGILSKEEILELDEYVSIAKETAKIKDDEKAQAIHTLINKS